MPKTKPKACNYGLHFSRGEYLTIYDAEDIPDTDQLKKVIKLFNKFPTALYLRINAH
jgi:cellulose synthase/poly-beta-1,6-N-acetylglucosamine synthase-like glycosyltransferase